MRSFEYSANFGGYGDFELENVTFSLIREHNKKSQWLSDAEYGEYDGNHRHGKCFFF